MTEKIQKATEPVTKRPKTTQVATRLARLYRLDRPGTDDGCDVGPFHRGYCASCGKTELK